MEKIKLLVFSILVLLNLSNVSGEPHVVSVLSDDVEFILEILIAVLSVIAALIAIQARKLVKGGQLEKSINALAISALVFAILEVYQIIKSLYLKITGLSDIIELVFVIFLIIGFIRAKNALK